MNKLFIILIFAFINLNASIVGATKGEFSVNQGSANYSLKIVTPKGIAGLKPSLAINYSSSNNSNGLLGIGFSLSGLSQISKCNQSLFKERKDSSRTYNYCLDGQKLITEDISSVYGSNTTYKTEIDSYSKIIKETNNWTVYTKDGLIYKYTSLLIADGIKYSDSIFYLNEISDRFNNKILFKYNLKTKNIAQISYANNKIDFIYEDRIAKKTIYNRLVKFDFSKRLKNISIKTNNTEISSYRLSYESNKYIERIKSINECIDNNCLEPLVFKWNSSIEEPSPKHLFSSLSKWNRSATKAEQYFPLWGNGSYSQFIDINADGLPDRAYHYNYRTKEYGYWVQLNTGNGFTPMQNWGTNASRNEQYFPSWGNGKYSQFIDINGDKLPDRVHHHNYTTNESGSWVQLNTGSSFGPMQKWNRSATKAEQYFPLWGNGSYSQFIDINADGLPDRAYHYNYRTKEYGYWVQLNTGNGFTPMQNWGTNASRNEQYFPSWGNGKYSQFIDINGDGLPDRVHHHNYTTNESGSWVQLNTGSSFGPMQKWNRSATKAEQYFPSWGNGSYSQFIDINADGLPDRAYHYNYRTKEYGYWVQLNTGSGFTPMQNWGTNASRNEQYFPSWENGKYSQFVDINGDSLPDRVHHHNYTTNESGLWVQLNTGSSFGPMQKWNRSATKAEQYFPSWGNGSYSQFVDINGDGLPDRIHHYNYSEKETGYWVQINNYNKSTLTSITNNKSQNISIKYSNLKDKAIYSSSSTLTYPNKSIKLSSMQVVKSFTADNGVGGQNTTSFKYKDFAINYERGGLGFKEIETLNKESNSKSIVKYNQSYPYIRSAISSKTFINNTLITESNSVNSHKVLGNTLQVYNKSSITKSYSFDSGSLLTTKTILNENFDNYGNIGKITTVTEGNGDVFKKISKNIYYNDTSRWILSRLKDAEVTHVSANTSNIIRKSKFKYKTNTGTLEQEIIEPGNSLSLTKTYVYSSKGNKISETISGKNILTRTTTYKYDHNEKNQTIVINPLNQSETRTYDIRNQLISLIGPNQLTTTWIYDDMGRKIKELRADGNYTTWTYSWTESGHKVIEKINNKYPATVYYDKLGRKIKTEKIGFDGNTIYETIEYDKLGNKVKTSTPYFEGESPDYVEYEYDEANRLIEVISPAPHNETKSDTIEYNDFETIKTNSKGQTKTTTINAIEKVIKIDDGSIITYKYDSVGNLVKTTDAKGNEILITYDILGNKISQNDPDLGLWHYKYNALKQLVSQTDAKNQKTTFTYDILGRILTKTTPEGTVSYKYDIGTKAIGKITKENGIGVSKEYTYDKYGRNSTVKTIIDGKSYIQKIVYDELGRVDKKIEPNNIEIKNNYNENGYLESITTPKLNARGHNKDTLIHEMNYDIEEYLKNKRLSIEYQNQITQYKAKIARYQVIIDMYKNDADARSTITELKNHVNSLNDLIYSLEGIVSNYNSQTKELSFSGVERWLDASNSSEVSNIYQNFSTELIDIAEYSFSLLEELKAKKEETKHLLYCGQIAGISIFCPDDMTRLATSSYKDEDNILFYGTNPQIVSYYEKALNDLQKDVNYIKDLQQKIEHHNTLAKAYENKSSAYSEIVNSNEIYFYKVLEQNSFGIVTSYLSGNGLETKKEFDTSGTLYSIKTGYESGDEIRDLSFEYDSLSNVTSRNDNKLGVNHNLIYDSLNRLIYANIDTKGQSSVLSYAYDTLGNMTYKSDIGSYDYATSKPHAVSKIGDKNFTYDANGNMVNNAGKLIDYTSFNKPKRIQTSSHVVTFDYDANNSRYKKTSNSDTVHYIGKSYEKNFRNNGVLNEKYFIYAGGKLVSIFTNENSQYGVKYLHYDNLGSIDTITDLNGLVVERMAYKPFGKQLNLDKYGNEVSAVSPTTNRGYTGHEHIKEAGFIHMNGRVYDPSIGRFLSADPHIQAPYDSQSYNRYTYVKNNPYKYTDPSGFFLKKIFKKIRKLVSFKNSFKYGMVLGLKPVQKFFIKHKWAQVAGSIFAGIYGGPLGSAIWAAYITDIHGGSTGDIIKSGAIAIASAEISSMIGDIGQGITNAAARESASAVMHGITRSAITKAQGGRWSSGFWSGFASSLIGSFAQGIKNTNLEVRTAISSVSSGLVSKISGGKFSNGAVTGAFVYLFNHARHIAQSQVEEGIKKGFSLSIINDGTGENGFYAVNSKFAEAYGAGINNNGYVNQRSTACIDSFSCSVARGMFDVGSDVDDLIDILNHSTSISSKLLNTLGVAAKIVGRPIGAINGAYEYSKNK